MTLPLDLDLERLGRCGFPEVVFGLGKTTEEVVTAARRLAEHHGHQPGVWLKLAKVSSGIASMTSDEAVDVGLWPLAA